MMFRTPNLEQMLVTWHLQPQQFPAGVTVGNEEFLAERFIEDIMDGDTSVALVIEEVILPLELPVTEHTDVPVKFKVLTTKDMARRLIELGYKVMDGDNEPGMPWGEVQRMLAYDISTGELSAFGEALFTDDTNPNAPWYRCRCLKKDDRGWFLALEIVE